ncbi:MAG TPA: homoserine kinase [Actinomycetales bacterium]|nr:homoserine kinase [Actinomycetales bacterium]
MGDFEALRLGEPVTVRVPGSSANLGPGFDAIGLALGVYDEVEVTACAEPGVEVEVVGEGADRVSAGEDHLVVRSVRAALERVGVEQPGLRLRCRNGVPHGRGIGSSATAVVTGVVAARGLLQQPELLDDVTAVEVASDLEGHPDNASASLLGGLTIGWSGAGGTRAVRVEPHPEVVAVVCIPDGELATARARAMLPGLVPHADAAFTAGRAALLVEAMTRRPDLLLPATQEKLHQGYRASAMPETATLLEALRSAGLAAVVSGAGPSLLVLGGADDRVEQRVRDVAGPGWDVRAPGIDLHGAVLTRA